MTTNATDMYAGQVGYYHWRDGIYFRRNDDGSVRVASQTHAILFDVPPNEWASIVAHVSAKGETGEAFARAQAFHAGESDSVNRPTGRGESSPPENPPGTGSSQERQP
jgi:hypothetical protein